jgi:hypothetical protein
LGRFSRALWRSEGNAYKNTVASNQHGIAAAHPDNVMIYSFYIGGLEGEGACHVSIAGISIYASLRHRSDDPFGRAHA